MGKILTYVSELIFPDLPILVSLLCSDKIFSKCSWRLLNSRRLLKKHMKVQLVCLFLLWNNLSSRLNYEINYHRHSVNSPFTHRRVAVDSQLLEQKMDDKKLLTSISPTSCTCRLLNSVRLKQTLFDI